VKDCPTCNEQLPDDAEFCGVCGTRQPAATPGAASVVGATTVATAPASDSGSSSPTPAATPSEAILPDDSSDHVPPPTPLPASAPQEPGSDLAVTASPGRPGVSSGVIIGAALILLSTALPWIARGWDLSGIPISVVIGSDRVSVQLTPWLSVATLLIGLGVAALALHRFRWARIAAGGFAVAVTAATVWNSLRLFGFDTSDAFRRAIGIGPYVALVGGLVLLFQWRSSR